MCVNKCPNKTEFRPDEYCKEVRSFYISFVYFAIHIYLSFSVCFNHMTSHVGASPFEDLVRQNNPSTFILKSNTYSIDLFCQTDKLEM